MSHDSLQSLTTPTLVAAAIAGAICGLAIAIFVPPAAIVLAVAAVVSASIVHMRKPTGVSKIDALAASAVVAVLFYLVLALTQS